MTTSATEPPPSPSPSVIRIRGGDTAAARARRHVFREFDNDVSASRVSDAALIVSELVTNSVLHASIGVHEELVLELTSLRDHLHIAVIDSGSALEPCIRPFEPDVPGGFGLRLVEEVSSAWGVVRDATGTTRVWCDLRLDRDAGAATDVPRQLRDLTA